MKTKEIYVKPDFELIDIDLEEIIATSPLEKRDDDIYNVTGPARSKGLWRE